MNEFLTKIVYAILESTENFQIKQENQDNLTVYTILTAGEAVGKVIGKDGKVINAIRTLCRIKALPTGQRVLVKVDKI